MGSSLFGEITLVGNLVLERVILSLLWVNNEVQIFDIIFATSFMLLFIYMYHSAGCFFVFNFHNVNLRLFFLWFVILEHFTNQKLVTLDMLDKHTGPLCPTFENI